MEEQEKAEMLSEALDKPIWADIKQEDIEAFLKYLETTKKKESEPKHKTCKGCGFNHPDREYKCSLHSSECISLVSKYMYTPLDTLLELRKGYKVKEVKVPVINGQKYA